MLGSFTGVWLFATLWTLPHQAPLSMGFFRQEYWSGLPFPSPGDLPDPGVEPWSPPFQADALTSEPPGKLGRAINIKSEFPISHAAGGFFTAEPHMLILHRDVGSIN